MNEHGLSSEGCSVKAQSNALQPLVNSPPLLSVRKQGYCRQLVTRHVGYGVAGDAEVAVGKGQSVAVQKCKRPRRACMGEEQEDAQCCLAMASVDVQSLPRHRPSTTDCWIHSDKL